VYIFPRPLSSAGIIQDGALQVRNMMNNLINGGAGDMFTSVWLDVEGGDLYWSRTIANNIKFIEQMISEAKKYQPKYKLGIYTSKSQWAPIVGSGYTGGKDFPLWYASYNGQTNFNDFSAFAGWTTPTLHQYAGDKTVCGVGCDLNLMTVGTLADVAGRAPINGGAAPPPVPIANSPKCALQRGQCSDISQSPCVGTVQKGLCPGPASVVCCVVAPTLRSAPGTAALSASTDAPIVAEAVDTGKVTWRRDRPRPHNYRRLKMGGLLRIKRKQHRRNRRNKKGKKKRMVRASTPRPRDD